MSFGSFPSKALALSSLLLFQVANSPVPLSSSASIRLWVQGGSPSPQEVGQVGNKGNLHPGLVFGSPLTEYGKIQRSSFTMSKVPGKCWYHHLSLRWLYINNFGINTKRICGCVCLDAASWSAPPTHTCLKVIARPTIPAPHSHQVLAELHCRLLGS